MKDSSTRPSFKEALKFWFKLGWISFGGTAGHINIMHEELVNSKKWISNSRFFHALNLCMLLPGPEAQQLAIYIGWQLHGKKGGWIAGTLFVLPSMLILLLLSMAYILLGNQPWMFAMFNGFKPAVISIIFVALLSIGKKALNTWFHYVIALISFFAIFLYNLSMPVIIFGTIGLAVMVQLTFPGFMNKQQVKTQEVTGEETGFYFNKYSKAAGSGATYWKVLKQLTVFVLLWLLPVILLYFFAPDFTFWKSLILFFTQTALLTIGGSYTVLPYVAQFAVSKSGWLSKMQMIDGFALAETTPGPLIIVVCFVGFMAASTHFGGSVLMGTIGLILTTFNTFLPSFLFIFIGGPVIEKTHGNSIIAPILSSVTAAVTGVILNLTFYLGKDILFPQDVSVKSADIYALIWILITMVMMKRFKVNVLYIIVLSLIFGLLHYH